MNQGHHPHLPSGYWPRLDILRVIAAFGVVLIHAPSFAYALHPPDGIQWLAAFFGTCARLAVPFFFVVSGYLLADRNFDLLSVRWSRSARRTLILFGAYTLLYAAIPVFIALCRDRSMSAALWFPLELLKDPASTVLGGASHHLWFLPQLVVGQAAAMLTLRWSQSAWPSGILATSIILINSLYVHHLLTPGSIASDYIPAFIHMITAVAGVSAGAWLARTPRKPSFVLLFGIGLLWRLFELYQTNAWHSPLALAEFWPGSSTIILALAAVAWATAPDAVSSRPSMLRPVAAISVGIYLLHPAVMLILDKIPALVTSAGVLRAPLVFLATLALARLMFKLPFTRPLVS